MSKIGHKVILSTQRFTLVLLSTVLMATSSPIYVLAADGDPGDPGVITSTEADTPPNEGTVTKQDEPAPTCPTVVGVNAPTGASASTYALNTSTCLYENDYYIWSPVTKQYTEKTPLVYTYNPATGRWDSAQWDFYAASNAYVLDAFSVTSPPPGAKTVGGPQMLISGAGSGSANNINGTTTNGITLTNGNNFGIVNGITGISLSGNASVLANTFGGSAGSGNALAMANVLNMLQSTSGLGTATGFVVTLNGDVQGDLLIDPSLLQPASGSETLTKTNNIDVNNKTDASITNNIDLTATSGDATVDSNTTAGDATTGNATAMANVINMINSMIAANQSFVGVININGNFNGNILMPQKFLDALIASNAPQATVTISQDSNSTTNIKNTTTQNVNNDVNVSATSGNATVADNTTAGNATSGKASTSVTIFDLTGNDIDASNTMLVFVNVLGTWVGLLMNAPQGSTAAAYGGNITRNITTNTNVTNTTDETINNNITVAATSGDAAVTKNTTAGNAKTGDAKAAVNLANIMNSHLNLSGWFGILFINVWGNWNGNFGIANPLAMPGAGSGDQTASSSDPPPVFQFKAEYGPASVNKPAAGAATNFFANSAAGLTDASLNAAKTVGTVLGAATPPTKPPTQSHSSFAPNGFAIFIVSIGVGLLLVERYLTIRARL